MQHPATCTSRCVVFIYLLLCCAESLSQSSSLPLKQFSLPEDLPAITCMEEDHNGFIWLGTLEGLYRFDGIRYVFHSDTDMQEGLGREFISSLFEDNKKTLWVGARSGLYSYIRDSQAFKKYSPADEVYPYYIHQENDSCFFIHCSKGVYLFYPATNRWELQNMGLDPTTTYAVRRGRQQDVWAGTDFAIRRFNLTKKTWQDYPLPIPATVQPNEKLSVHSIFLDSHDQLWINTWQKGVIRLDTRSGIMQIMNTDPGTANDDLQDLFNPSITEDADTNVWLASHCCGLSVYNSRTKTMRQIPKAPEYTIGLHGGRFGMMFDRNDNLWISSEKNLYYHSRQSAIPKLPAVKTDSFPDAHFMEFLSDDVAVMGSFFGFYSYHVPSGKIINHNAAIGLPASHNAALQSVSDIYLASPTSCYITSPQGLRRITWSGATNSQLHTVALEQFFPTRPAFWPSEIIPVNDSLLVVRGRTNTRSFATFHMLSGTYTYYEFPDSLRINQIALLRSDTLLMGIRNHGLFRYHLADRSMELITWEMEGAAMKIVKPVFHQIVPLQQGRFGICTENYGLLLFTPATGKFKHIDVTVVGRTNIVFSVAEDINQNLWIQTASQLLFYNTSTQKLAKINLSDSFKGHHPAFHLHHGHQLLTTFEGNLYTIDISEVNVIKQKPRLYLEKITAGNVPLSWSGPGRIHLPYANNFLTYHFIGLDYDNPRGLSYYYKIPELSEEWVFLDNNTSVSIGQLGPGTYHCILKASNDAGLWSDEIQAPAIRIRAPFWRTWWFILAFSSVAMFLTYYIVKVRRSRIESEIRLRNQIARDLHDDIGSTLSGIKIFSSIAADMVKGHTDLAAVLHQIRDKSDDMMQSMSDIVWSINPAHDTLHDMMIRVKQYMSEVLERQQIEVSFTSSVDLKHVKINLSHRKELYLAFKEIIHNAAKHADCKHFSLHIQREKGELVFFIRDDGIGMDQYAIVPGNGLSNIETRIRQMRGTLKRESTPGNGTSYQITIQTSQAQ